MKNRTFTILISCALAAVPTARAQHEIGFIEKFALADDREAALKDLIAGTEEYYFFHALHYQSSGKAGEFDAIMKQWAERYPNSAAREPIIARQKLKNYDTDPEGTLQWLKSKLNLNFDHQQQPRDPIPQYPSKLDGALISREAFWQRALANQDNLDAVHDSAFFWIMAEKKKLTTEQRNELLSRISRPDYPNLVELIAEESQEKKSAGFGGYPIHKQLLLTQLDTLLRKFPSLMKSSLFVEAYVAKLMPGADTNMDRDPAAKLAWFQRVQPFVDQLGSPFNSLKAHVLYQRLVFDQEQGLRDEGRFMAYLRLPRAVPYLCEAFTKSKAFTQPADLNANFEGLTKCPVIQNDTALVRGYLLHFLKDAPNAEAYTKILADSFVLPILAECKLVNGLGEAEKWFSMLGPQSVQALRQRVDLDFDPANRDHFAPGDDVSLTLHVKNVPQLLVKVFEINTENYCETQTTEINTDINLDGLVPALEKSFNYAEAPILRMPRVIAFPELKGRRGIWVADFIGNGVASRALIRKGSLHAISRVAAGGTAVTVLDEDWKIVPTAFAKLGGQRFEAMENGEILIPFSAKSGNQSIIIGNGDGFCARQDIDLARESYDGTKSKFYVNFENLLPRSKATVLLRPRLELFGTDISVARIREPKVTVTTRDMDGIESVVLIPVKLEDARDTSFEISVPDRLASVSFLLQGKVKTLTTGADEEISVSQEEWVNAFCTSEFTADIHLSNFDGVWTLEFLGRTGEPVPDKAVEVQLCHQDFETPIYVLLKTSPSGIIVLGDLQGIEKIGASAGITRFWDLPHDRCAMPQNLHANVGEAIKIPWFGGDKATGVSLLEVLGDNYIRDASDHLRVAQPYLVLEGLPAGDYELSIPPQNEKTTIRVIEGSRQQSYLLSERRILEESPPPVLQIAGVAKIGAHLVVSLDGVRKSARVHVIASRFLHQATAFDRLAMESREPRMGEPGELFTQFVSGRILGDEFRYVINRKLAAKLPGSMLPRPGLLLNPWEINDTQLERLEVGQGFDFASGAMGDPMAAPVPASDPLAPASPSPPLLAPCYDFLANAAPSHFHLVPDEKGEVRVLLAALGDRQFLQIVAEDFTNTTVRYYSLPAKDLKTLDLRLRNGLDVKEHFAQVNEIAILEKDKSLTIAAGSQFNSQSDLGLMFNFLTAINPLAELETFRFVLDWPTFDAAKKREMYSKFACHELNFLLWRKDPQFFDAVIKPYLANKKDKTFMDQFLLGSDLSDFLRPWKFGRLNTLERILLAKRLPHQRDSIKRDLSDELSLLQIDPSVVRKRYNYGFSNAAHSDPPDPVIPQQVGAQIENSRASFPMTPTTPNDTVVTEANFEGAPKPVIELGKKAVTIRNPAEGESLQSVLEKKQGGNARQNQPGQDDSYGWKSDDAERLASDLARAEDLTKADRLWRKLDATEEFAENNYWKQWIETQVASLVPVNAFWNDYALWDGNSPFVSRNVIYVGDSHTEMLLALAVTDLPFPGEAGEIKISRADNGSALSSPNACLVFHKALRPAPMQEKATSLLVSQNFFREGDRYIEAHGERQDKFVTEEFLAGVVYGCQVVVTNPSSSRQQLEVLAQIPQGAVGVLGTKTTSSTPMGVESYQTETLEFFFYFPAAGKFTHYPVHISSGGKTVAFAQPFSFNVLDHPSTLDTSSWLHVSQYGTDAETLAFLEQNNLRSIDLNLMNWRLRKVDFFRHALALLESRHFYHPATYSYAILHNDTQALRDFLLHQEALLRQCGPAFDSTLVRTDPVARHWYQHLEYSPLANARAHQLGISRTILNDLFFSQYQTFLYLLAHLPQLTEEDHLAVASYLLLQDRIDEALDHFAKIDPAKITEQLQYDYLKSVLALYQEDPAAARAIAEKHLKEPVDKWREKFEQVLAQTAELSGKAPDKINAENREQTQEAAAAMDPTFDFSVDGGSVSLKYQNLGTATVNYYLMDLELLFSANPFLNDDAARFRLVKPNRTDALNLPAEGKLTFQIPQELRGKNVLVELTGAGKSVAHPSYANTMNVQISENFGRLQVLDGPGGKPLSKVYVKVFAEENGAVKFYKDGYTDLRGKFDYVSLSTGQLDQTTRFALLILSDDHGAVVREVKPPQQ